MTIKQIFQNAMTGVNLESAINALQTVVNQLATAEEKADARAKYNRDEAAKYQALSERNSEEAEKAARIKLKLEEILS